MDIFLLSLSLLFILLLFVWIRKLQKNLQEAEKQLGELHRRVEALAEQGEGEFTKSSFSISIELEDPIALAKSRSSLAKWVSNVSPNFIEEKVYQKVQEELQNAFQEKEIPSKIRIKPLFSWA